MMGIPIDDAMHIYGDSMSMIHNILKPESTLHEDRIVHESVAMGESLTLKLMAMRISWTYWQGSSEVGRESI